jgi:hypothetical protein
MNVRAGCVACALVLLPVAAGAQTISGSIEGSGGAGSSTSNGQAQQNNSFWQGYSLGFASPLINPKLMKIDTEVSFRSGSLNFFAPENDQQGKQRDLGYKLGGTLFPEGKFPFTIQATRDNVEESGTYPSWDGIRGGIVVPPGEPSPDFRTRMKALTMGWQLSAERLPHVEFGYRDATSEVTGGPYYGEQRDGQLHLGMSQATRRTQQALRFDRNSFESPVAQAYNQRFDDLNYEFGATLSNRFHATARVGRRNQFSVFEVPSDTESGTGEGYRPPLRGDVSTLYTVSTLSYQPWRRLAFDVSGSFDRQRAAGASTDARVATGSTRLDLVRGLTVTALGTYGDRGQIVEDVPITVRTKTGLAGVTYRAGVRWLQGSVGYSVGGGTNTTPEGQTGNVRSESGEAGLSLSIKGVGLSGGYERSKAQDEILDYGNYAIERSHAAVNTQAGRVTLNASAERARVDRGRGATFSTNLQQSVSGNASLRIGRESQVTASVGGFQNRGTFGDDRAVFAGVGLESQLAKQLHLSAWVRQGDMVASLTKLDQKTLHAFASLEYRLRQFNLAVEYRNTQQNLVTSDLTEPYNFRGHQVLLRLSRKFGKRL